MVRKKNDVRTDIFGQWRTIHRKPAIMVEEALTKQVLQQGWSRNI